MPDNSYLLEDMQKYFPNFNRSEYESMSKEELIPICRDYYSTHLPVDVTAWLRVNTPAEDLIYRKGCAEQVMLVRDIIMVRLFYLLEHNEYDHVSRWNFQPLVIGTHCSKSVLLPVMRIDLKKFGVSLILRNNFYNWNVSVISEQPIECDFMETFDDDSTYKFCEGFPKDLIFGKYKDDNTRFTVCISYDHDLYTFVYLLRNYLKHR